MGKVFFSASIYSLPKSFDDYDNIIKVIKKTNNELVVDWLSDWKRKEKENEHDNEVDVGYFFNNTQKILNADFVIAEVSNPTVGVGYQVFYACLHKKRVLALYSAEADIKNIKKFINSDSHSVSLKKYSEKNLFYIINNFLSGEDVLKKFNFIASERIIDYIDWLVGHSGGKSKSDVLRELIINNVINEDIEYQKYLLR